MYSLNKHAALLIAGLLCSCSTYQPKPLSTQFSLPRTIPHVLMEQQRSVATLRVHPFDPDQGLAMDDVAMLAVLNNPELKIARDDAGLAHAQAFAAGLLPDPQLALSSDVSNTGGPGSTKAYSAGLSYDLMALIAYGAADAAAQAEHKQADMNLLWQEWQVIARARLLYVKLICAKKMTTLLEQNRSILEERVSHNQQAFDKHYIAADVLLPEVTALQELQKQSNDLERQLNQWQHELAALLGLSPQAKVLLQEAVGEPDLLPALDDEAISRDALPLVQRRPDLLALQSGYDAQDQRYRASILAQFPALNVGFTRARDSGGIYSNGLGVTLSLPLLNRNRGTIAVELASRDKLRDEYQQRLDMANSDIHQLLSDEHINRRQLSEITAALPQFSAMAEHSAVAYANHNFDGLVYANARSTLMAKQIEALSLQQAMLEQRIVLLTLTGQNN